MHLNRKFSVLKALAQSKVLTTGNFTLRSGKSSDFYVDMRQLSCHPKKMSYFANVLNEELLTKPLVGPAGHWDLYCGVPYGALPLTTLMANNADMPMVILRKKPKLYGKQKFVEGSFVEGQTVCLIEDVVTTGGSVISAIKKLRDVGLHVAYVGCILDREAGAEHSLRPYGVHYKSLVTLSELKRELL